MAREKPNALVIGGGPAGLMAAEELAREGCTVLLAEAKPSLGRKFLMAGKSGLNLTRAEPLQQMMPVYAEAADWLRPMIVDFDAAAVQGWARGLGQELFTGSTGRVFPVAMKASPLLRAWLARLDTLGVQRRTRWRWTGWQGDRVTFHTPEGPVTQQPDVTVLALGGASWARLGADGGWADILRAEGVELAPFTPANAGLSVNWSVQMARHFGQPVKGVEWRAGALHSRGEAVISARGLEGGGIYSISKAVRMGHPVQIDLLPERSLDDLVTRLSRPRGKASLSNHLRKTLRLDPARIALLNEFARPLPTDPAVLAQVIKALPLNHDGLRPLDEAISTAGGITRAALDVNLMLQARPGVFCAGEMLDWEAPTGGYLLTACFATGRWAGQAAARWVRNSNQAAITAALPSPRAGSGCG